MDWNLYMHALHASRMFMRRMCCKEIVDGRSAHDFAMDSIMRDPHSWGPTRVYFDIVDAIRRENGRRKLSGGGSEPIRKVSYCGFLHAFVGSVGVDLDDSDELFSDCIHRTTYRFVIQCLCRGYEKRTIAAMLGVSPTRVSQIVNEIRALIEVRRPDAVPKRGPEEVHVREASEDRLSVVEGDPEGKAPPQEGAEEGTPMRRTVASQKQHIMHEEMHRSGPKKVRMAEVPMKGRKAKPRRKGR